MNCNLCQAWYYISCVGIQDELLESTKGSLWLCDNCEEVFGHLQSRLDTLSSENTELRTMLKDLQDLPSVVKALQSQVESLSKDLAFVMHGATGNSTQIPNRVAASPAPPISLSNRFSSLSHDDHLVACQASVSKPATPPSTESATPSVCTLQLATPSKSHLHDSALLPAYKMTSHPARTGRLPNLPPSNIYPNQTLH